MPDMRLAIDGEILPGRFRLLPRHDARCCRDRILASLERRHATSGVIRPLRDRADDASRIENVDSARRPWRVHLAFATYLGLVSLIYNVWLMLALVYVVCGVRRQRWRHLAAGLLVAGAFAPIWRCILPPLGINLLDVEGDYLRRAALAVEGGCGGRYRELRHPDCCDDARGHHRDAIPTAVVAGSGGIVLYNRSRQEDVRSVSGRCSSAGLHVARAWGVGPRLHCLR